MKIADLIPSDAVEPALAARTKEGVLRELVALVVPRHVPGSPAEIVRLLLNREALGSTGLGEGVAIPHAKIPDLTHIVGALARSADGIDFDAADGQPTHLFVLLLVPEPEVTLHLKALARVSRLLKDADVRREVLAAATPDAMYHALTARDAAPETVGVPAS